jgi:Spy/CpxP family protein refolding chaperone
MKQFTQNRFLVLLVAILLVANLGVMLYFFVGKGNHDKHPSSNHPVSDFMQKQIGFNADQAAKFQALRDQHKQAVKPVINEIKMLKDSLYKLLQKPEVDDPAATNLVNEIGEKQKQWELMIFHHFQKLRALCDSSQLPKFDTLVHHMVTRDPWGHKKASHK